MSDFTQSTYTTSQKQMAREVPAGRECQNERCGKLADPRAGVEIRPGKWICKSCWAGRVTKTQWIEGNGNAAGLIKAGAARAAAKTK